MVKYNPMSRRMFLIGSGSFLGIPLLTSLLPRAVEAAIMGTPPLRFVSLVNDYGSNEKLFYGQFAHNTTGFQSAAGNALTSTVKYKKLTEVAGDISYGLSSFNALKAKTTIIRGLDIVSRGDADHPANFPLCGAGHNQGSNGYMPSVDQMIAGSSKVYPANWSTLRRHLNLTPAYSSNTQDNRSLVLNPSWKPGQAEKDRVILAQPISDTNTLLQRFIGSFGAGTAPVASTAPGGISRKDVLSKVYPMYQKLSSDSRLSAADKQKLENYMSLISEIQKDYQNEMVISQCSNPVIDKETVPPGPPAVEGKRNGEGDNVFIARSQAALASVNTWRQTARALEDIRFRNHMRILVAAMSCDLTRSAHIGLNFDGQGDLSHSWHHDSGMVDQDQNSGSPFARAFADQIRRSGSQVAALMTMMESVNESNGTLLDNSIVYWGQQFGCVYIRGDAHSSKNIPALIGGGGAGKINPGYLIDYRLKYNEAGNDQRYPTGIAMNNLLVSFMNAFGIGSTEYEYSAGQGYGNYDAFPGDMSAAIKSTAGRRTALPFFYKGPVVG